MSMNATDDEIKSGQTEDAYVYERDMDEGGYGMAWKLHSGPMTACEAAILVAMNNSNTKLMYIVSFGLHDDA
jgi:hypothetical protein